MYKKIVTAAERNTAKVVIAVYLLLTAFFVLLVQIGIFAPRVKIVPKRIKFFYFVPGCVQSTQARYWLFRRPSSVLFKRFTHYHVEIVSTVFLVWQIVAKIWIHAVITPPFHWISQNLPGPCYAGEIIVVRPDFLAHSLAFIGVVFKNFLLICNSRIKYSSTGLIIVSGKTVNDITPTFLYRVNFELSLRTSPFYNIFGCSVPELFQA